MGSDYIAHHGILGMKWGVRRYRNADGTLTEAGKKRRSKQIIRELNRTDNKRVYELTKAIPGAKKYERVAYNANKKIDQYNAKIAAHPEKTAKYGEKKAKQILRAEKHRKKLASQLEKVTEYENKINELMKEAYDMGVLVDAAGVQKRGYYDGWYQYYAPGVKFRRHYGPVS